MSKAGLEAGNRSYIKSKAIETQRQTNEAPSRLSFVPTFPLSPSHCILLFFAFSSSISFLPFLSGKGNANWLHPSLFRFFFFSFFFFLSLVSGKGNAKDNYENQRGICWVRFLFHCLHYIKLQLLAPSATASTLTLLLPLRRQLTWPSSGVSSWGIEKKRGRKESTKVSNQVQSILCKHDYRKIREIVREDDKGTITRSFLWREWNSAHSEQFIILVHCVSNTDYF